MNTADKTWALEKAIEIVKEYAKSGTDQDLAVVLENLYKKIKDLAKDAWAE